MTIYRMYADNGNRAGFWVQHRSWRNTCAQVESVAGQRLGKLPGISPLYDSAEVVVRCYDVRSGRPIHPGPDLQTPQDSHYRIIAQPCWFRGGKDVPAPLGAAK